MKKTLLAIIPVLMLSGCAGSPAAPDTPAFTSPEKEYAAAQVQEFAARLGLSPQPRVLFEMPPYQTNPPMGGWVVPGDYAVHFNAWWITWAAQADVRAMAAHETCHLSGLRSEEEAEACKRSLL